MSGYWNLSRMQQSDLNGDPLAGALAYFYQSGTLTPMVVYQDTSFALAHPNPVEADGYGRFPGVFFDDTSFSFYRMRVTDAAGSLIFDDDAVPIIGQTAPEGDPPTPVDQNGLVITGDFLLSYSTGARAGFVRANGRTVGSAVSGATERANADTQPLFEHLWAADANLTVSGGRGGSAAADWAADKQITLPDLRHRSPIGTGDMGNANAARIAAGFVDAPYTPTGLGGSGGEDDIALLTTNLAAHTHAPGTLKAAAHRHFAVANGSDVGGAPSLSATSSMAEQGSYGSDNDYFLNRGTGEASISRTSSAGPLDMTGATDTTGAGAAHENMPPFLLLTVYIRL